MAKSRVKKNEITIELTDLELIALRLAAKESGTEIQEYFSNYNKNFIKGLYSGRLEELIDDSDIVSAISKKVEEIKEEV